MPGKCKFHKSSMSTEPEVTANRWCFWQGNISGDKQREVKYHSKCFLIAGCHDLIQLSCAKYPRGCSEAQEYGRWFQGGNMLQATSMWITTLGRKRPSQKRGEGKWLSPPSPWLAGLCLWQRHALSPQKGGVIRVPDETYKINGKRDLQPKFRFYQSWFPPQLGGPPRRHT